MKLYCNAWNYRIILALLLVIMPLTASYAAALDFNAMMAAFQKNLPNIVRLIVAVSYIMGIWMVFSALYGLKIYGDMRTMMPTQASLGNYFFRMILGVILLLMPKMVKVTIYSLWGVGYTIPTAYTAPVGMQQWQQAIDGVIAVIRVFGYISFVRGFMILSRASRQGSQPGQHGKGILHIVGGILSINIVGTIKIIQRSFGV